MGNAESKTLILQVGLLSATAVAAAYILCGPKPASGNFTDSTIDIRGYYNVGNSCYINSLLQALAASHQSVNYINNYYELKRIYSKIQGNGPAFPIFSCLATSQQHINRDSVYMDAASSRQIPKTVIATFKAWSQVSLATHEEQDAHEFFSTIMTAVLEEQKAIQSHPDFLEGVKTVESCSVSFSPLNNNPDQETLPQEAEVKNITSAKLCGVANLLVKSSVRASIITKLSTAEDARCPASLSNLGKWNNPFLGRFATSLQCISCLSTVSIKLEDFTDLTLMLPAKIMPTLMDLIGHYFSPEVVHSVDCKNCSKRFDKPTKSSFHRRTFISKFPQSLCLHINRATWDGSGCFSKRFDFISFPRLLDLSSVSTLSDLMTFSMNGRTVPSGHTTSLRKSVEYNLMAVICHRGSIDSGHFVTYRRSPAKYRSGTWYLVSDNDIIEVMEEQVLLQHAYMLFYDRVHPG